MALAVDRAQPYPGNFRCSDELLTKIWYTGIYTQDISIGGVASTVMGFDNILMVGKEIVPYGVQMSGSKS